MTGGKEAMKSDEEKINILLNGWLKCEERQTRGSDRERKKRKKRKQG